MCRDINVLVFSNLMSFLCINNTEKFIIELIRINHSFPCSVSNNIISREFIKTLLELYRRYSDSNKLNQHFVF